MTMLILQSFLLFLVSALLGAGLGHLLHEAYGADFDTVDRPWLRDLGRLPAAPALPAAPTLMDAGERARLTASLTAAPPMPTPVPPPAPIVAPAVAVAPPAPVVEPAPATVVEPAPAVVEAPAAAAPAPASPEVPPVVAPPVVAPPVAVEAIERARAADAVGSRPGGLTAAEGGVPDDLELIKGIGPKNAKGLHDLGIWHFAQIAAWTPENVAWVGSFLAFPGRIEREKWVDQAEAFLAAKR